MANLPSHNPIPPEVQRRALKDPFAQPEAPQGPPNGWRPVSPAPPPDAPENPLLDALRPTLGDDQQAPEKDLLTQLLAQLGIG